MPESMETLTSISSALTAGSQSGSLTRRPSSPDRTGPVMVAGSTFDPIARHTSDLEDALAGEAPVQVTRNGGFEGCESPDGKSVYYVRERTGGAVEVPVAGGPETRVPKTGTVTASSWTVIDNGILWIDVTASNPPATIRFHDLATHEVSNISQVTSSVIPSATGFSAVRDGSVLMWSQLDRSAADLMLVETSR